MNSCCQKLPGVKKIYYTDCSYLPKRIDLQAIAGMSVAVPADLVEINFFGAPDCSKTTERSNKGWHESSELSFFSLDDIPVYKHIAFIVTDVNGDSFLIGAYEGPFPVVKVKKSTGAPDGDRAGFQYSVSHNSLRSLVKCFI